MNISRFNKVGLTSHTSMANNKHEIALSLAGPIDLAQVVHGQI